MNRVWIAGETIRRERGAHGKTIEMVLRHLEVRGFDYAPRHLGIDEQGRDILSWLDGEPVPTLRGQEQLEDVGRLVRAFHDAIADFTPPDNALWRNAQGSLGWGQIVIHGDIAPWNLLERDGLISGLVDWDTARPGRSIEDLAYSAWHFVPMHGERMGDGTSGPPLAERPGRLGQLLDAYGLNDQWRAVFLSEVAKMQVEGAAGVARAALAGDRPMQRHWNEGRFATTVARSLLWLEEHRDALSRVL